MCQVFLPLFAHLAVVAVAHRKAGKLEGKRPGIGPADLPYHAIRTVQGNQVSIGSKQCVPRTRQTGDEIYELLSREQQSCME